MINIYRIKAKTTKILKCIQTLLTAKMYTTYTAKIYTTFYNVTVYVIKLSLTAKRIYFYCISCVIFYC